MAEYYKIKGETLTAIGDAIRTKTGGTEQLTLDQMVTEIGSIQTGGGSSSFPSAAEVTFGYVKKTETVTEQAPDGKCWYNGLLLPEIPADVLASYPYAWIRNNDNTKYYDLVFTKVVGYYNASAGTSNGGIVYGANSATAEIAHYRVAYADAGTADSWEHYETSTAWMGLDANRVMLWSNHDIPNGSATATEIYFKGSEPLTELTETITTHVPVERGSEYAVKSANLNNIAKRTQEMAGTTKLMTPEDIIYFLNRVKFIPQSTATSEFTLEFDAGAVGRLPTVTKGDGTSEFSVSFVTVSSGE